MSHQTKTHGQLLSDALKERGIKLGEYYAIMENAGLSHNTARAFVTTETKEIKSPNLCLICSLFGLSPADFGLPPDYFKSNYSFSEGELCSYNFRKEGDSNYRPFIENFFEKINKYLLSARQRLYVCDYFPKTRGLALKEHVTFYRQESKKYFLNLEKILAEQNVQYKRIAQLSLGSQATFEEAVKIIIEEMFPEIFGHFCRCLKHFQHQCEFYVVLQPFRLHTYYLVDDHVSLTEYHRYDKSGIPMPDTLFVNKCDPGNPQSVGAVYFDSCFDEFERIIKTPTNSQHRLTDAILFQNTVELNRELESQLKQVKHAMQSKEDAVRSATGNHGQSLAELFKELHTLKSEHFRLERRHAVIQKKMEVVSEILNA